MNVESVRPSGIKTNGSAKTEYEIALPSLPVGFREAVPYGVGWVRRGRVGHPPGTIFSYSWGVKGDRGCHI